MSDWFNSYGYAEVFPDLLLGAYPVDEHDVERLAAEGVQRVLNLAADNEYRVGQRAATVRALAAHGIEEQRISLVDFGGLPAAQIEAAVDVILGWMRDDVRGYVHCRAGWQRSAAVVAGAIAVYNDVEPRTALAYVQRAKPSADPLPHQLVDLEQWWSDRAEAPARP